MAIERSDHQSLYVNVRRRCPVLNRTSFNELHAKYKAGDLAARDLLVHSNIGLVLKIATRYINRGVALDVLVQAGLESLLRSALPKFEPERGLRFSTYATHWIRQGCVREIKCTTPSRPYGVPTHALDIRQTLSNIETRMSHILGRHVGEEEVRAEYERRNTGKKKTGKKDSFWRWVFLTEHVLSMDAPLKSDASTSLHEFLSNEEDAIRNPESLAALRELQGKVQGALEQISSKERAVLISYFGLGVPPRTLQQVGAVHGVTRERTRQIEAQALTRVGLILELSKEEVVELLKGLSPSWPVQEERRLEPMISPDIDESDLLNVFAILCEHAIDRLDDGHSRVKAPERTLHARLHLVPEESQVFLRAMQSKGWLRFDVRLKEAEILRLDYVPLSL